MNNYVNKVINMAFRVTPLSSDEKLFVKNGYNDETKQKLIDVATFKKILPVVGKLLTVLDVDRQFWEERYTYFKNRNIEITGLIDKVFANFAKAGINRICAFENYGAMLSAQTDIALYSSGDVDLYADVSQKEHIIKAMADMKYYPTDNDANLKNINTEFLCESGIVRINIAWKPLVRYILPIGFDAGKYFNWDKMKYYQNTAIRLPEADTLLYMCFLRVAVHGYSRSPDIRLYIDTYNASFNNPDWEKVMQWAKADGTLTKFVTVAKIAHSLIGVDVPEFVLKAAKGNKFAQKIIRITYDYDNNTLLYDPSGIELMRLEAASDERSLAGELLHMLFPPVRWLKEYYQVNGENSLMKYVHYYKRLL